MEMMNPHTRYKRWVMDMVALAVPVCVCVCKVWILVYVCVCVDVQLMCDVPSRGRVCFIWRSTGKKEEQGREGEIYVPVCVCVCV